MTTTTLKSRMSNIPGGLDNAVRQAEERGFEKLNIIDADAHQREPFSYFIEYLDEKSRNIFEGKEDPYQKEEDPRLTGAVPRRTRSFREAHQLNFGPGDDPTQFNGHRVRRTETGFVNGPTPPEEIIKIFTQRMHDIGIKKSLVFPTGLLGLHFDEGHELEVAVADAYNHFMHDQFAKYPDILRSIMAPMSMPEEAAEQINKFGGSSGVVGVHVTGMVDTASNGKWGPVFEAAEKKRLPILYHAGGGPGGPGFGGGNKFVTQHSLSFPFPLITQCVGLVMSGAPELYPKLKFAFIEGGVSWIPWIKQRLDDEWLKRKNEAPVLKKFPSEYMDDFYYTTQPLEHAKDPTMLEKTFSMFDAENKLLYASDYPHWDFDTPSVVWDLPFLDTTAKKKILGGNAMKFFRMD